MKALASALFRTKASSLEVARASLPAHVMICHHCDLRTKLPNLLPGMEARCPRCNELLCAIPHAPYDGPLAWAASAICFLILSCGFPFLALSVQGVKSEVSLWQSAEALIHLDFQLLAQLVLFFVVVIPALFLLTVTYLYENLRQSRKSPAMAFLCRTVSRLKPWMMADVFLLGVFVSMIKMASLADLSPGWSFWAFLGFMICLTRATSLVNAHWLHHQLAVLNGKTPIGAEIKNMLSCEVCGFLSPEKNHHCVHCAAPLHHRRPHSLQITLALLFASVVFYLPANLYPMMATEALGATTTATIMEGVILLWDMGSYPVALVILVASVFIPIIKMISISFLCFRATKSHQKTQVKKARSYTKLYRFTEFIGRWSMVDVFVVSILVALVQLGSLLSIYPGVASLSFAIVVILTMLSALSFDPRLLWDQTNDHQNSEKNHGRTHF